jgi:hypothetical protein
MTVNGFSAWRMPVFALFYFFARKLRVASTRF